MKNKAIVVLSAIQLLALNSACVFAEPVSGSSTRAMHGIAPTESDEKVRYKGKVSSDGGKKEAAAGSSKIEGKVFLRVNIESGSAGLNNDINTYYVDKKDDKVNGMTGAQYGQIVNSPLVQGRLAAWRAWYARLFEEIYPPGSKIPKGLRSKTDLTINKDHKVTATIAWMDRSDDPQVGEFQKKTLDKIRSFESQPWIAFPEKSYLDLLKLELYLQEDRVQLSCYSDLDID